MVKPVWRNSDSAAGVHVLCSVKVSGTGAIPANRLGRAWKSLQEDPLLGNTSTINISGTQVARVGVVGMAGSCGWFWDRYIFRLFVSKVDVDGVIYVFCFCGAWPAVCGWFCQVGR